MKEKRMFMCVSDKFLIYPFMVEYELLDEKSYYYELKFNAPKDCFEEVKREIQEEVEKEIKEPFTKEEKEVMDLLVEAHNKFNKIDKIDLRHQSDMTEWVDGIHKCQSVLQGRVVRRDYPNVFK